MKKILKRYSKLILFCRLTDNISATQRKLQYDTGVAMQYNAAHTGGTVQYWRQTQFQTLVNLSKWYIQILLVKNPHHSDSEN